MRFINFLFFAALLCLAGISVKGQDCQVLLKAIAGKYSGDCNKGKAEGNGKAEGKDQYTGAFKAGFPDGKGTYVWANGDAFVGMWVKGTRNGQGSMSKKDGTIITGFWEKDIYIGQYEKPFIINDQGSSITKSELKKDNNNNIKEKSIQLNISNTTGGATSLMGGAFPRPNLSDIVVLKGSYAQAVDGLETQVSIKKKLTNVIFPFRAKLTVDGQYFDFEILDPGAWTITLEISANTRLGGQ